MLACVPKVLMLIESQTSTGSSFLVFLQIIANRHERQIRESHFQLSARRPLTSGCTSTLGFCANESSGFLYNQLVYDGFSEWKFGDQANRLVFVRKCLVSVWLLLVDEKEPFWLVGFLSLYISYQENCCHQRHQRKSLQWCQNSC